MSSTSENATGHTHRVLQVRNLTDDVFVIRVSRDGFAFRGGQHVTLGVHRSGTNREYSIYSGESDPDLEFLVKIREGGANSRSLQACPPGAGVEVAGPFGEFTVPPEASRERHLFVSNGVGIAPFRSLVRSHPGLDYRLLHGVRRLADRYDMADYAPDRYVSCITSEAGGSFRGRVTDYLRAHPVAGPVRCYICGSNAMIDETYDVLRRQGVPSDNLFTEVFF